MKRRAFYGVICAVLVLLMASMVFVACNDNSIGKNESKYTLSFFSDGSMYKSIKLYEGDRLYFPEDPAKSGYVFEGWYDAQVGGTKVDSGTMPGRNLFLYAHFVRDENWHTVTFMLDGQKWMEFEGLAGTAIMLDDEPSRQGYLFDGWYDNEDYTGDRVAAPTEIGTQNAVYHGRLTPDENWHIVKFYVNGEEWLSFEGYSGTPIEIEHDPDMLGFIFDGWYDNDNFDGESVSAPTEIGDSNATYYAKFIPDGKKTVTFMVDGEIYQQFNEVAGSALQVDDPEADGKIFYGWYDNADFEGHPLRESEWNIIRADATYYAKFVDEDEPVYTLEMFINGVSVYKAVAFAGQPIRNFVRATDSNHIFDGWYTDPECTSEKVSLNFDGYMPVGGGTYYATDILIENPNVPYLESMWQYLTNIGANSISDSQNILFEASFDVIAGTKRDVDDIVSASTIHVDVEALADRIENGRNGAVKFAVSLGTADIFTAYYFCNQSSRLYLDFDGKNIVINTANNFTLSNILNDFYFNKEVSTAVDNTYTTFKRIVDAIVSTMGDDFSVDSLINSLFGVLEVDVYDYMHSSMFISLLKTLGIDDIEIYFDEQHNFKAQLFVEDFLANSAGELFPFSSSQNDDGPEVLRCNLSYFMNLLLTMLGSNQISAKDQEFLKNSNYYLDLVKTDDSVNSLHAIFDMVGLTEENDGTYPFIEIAFNDIKFDACDNAAAYTFGIDKSVYSTQVGIDINMNVDFEGIAINGNTCQKDRVEQRVRGLEMQYYDPDVPGPRDITEEELQTEVKIYQRMLSAFAYDRIIQLKDFSIAIKGCLDFKGDNSKLDIRVVYDGQDFVFISLYNRVFTIKLDNTVLLDPELPDSSVVKALDCLTNQFGPEFYNVLKNTFGLEVAHQFAEAYFEDPETSITCLDVHRAKGEWYGGEHRTCELAMFVKSDFNGFVFDFTGVDSAYKLNSLINMFIDVIISVSRESAQRAPENSSPNALASTDIFKAVLGLLAPNTETSFKFVTDDLFGFISLLAYDGDEDGFYHAAMEIFGSGADLAEAHFMMDLLVLGNKVYNPETDGDAGTYFVDTFIKQFGITAIFDFADGFKLSVDASIPAGASIGIRLSVQMFDVTEGSFNDYSKQGTFSFTASK